MDEMTNLVLAGNAIIHPYHIPGRELLSPKYKTKYVHVEEGAGMKVIHNGHAIFVRTEHDAANGPHVQFSIMVDNNAGESKWLPVGIGKIKDGVAVLEPLKVDKPHARYKVSKETWETYKEMMADTMKLLILYASICRIRYGLPIFDINHYWTTETLYTAVLPEDEIKKEEMKVEPAKTVEKNEADTLKDFAESLKKLSEEIKSLKEAQKNAESEENFKKWKEETTKFVMELVKTREIPTDNEGKTITSREIFLRLNKAVRGFCIGAHSLISESGASDSFLETISIHDTINMNNFMRLLSEPNIKRCQTALKEGTINQYRMTCKIESFHSGSVYYTFTLRDEILYRDGVTIMFTFDEKSRLVNPIKTIEQFEQMKTNPIFSYITSITGGDAANLCRSIAHICGDLKKKYIKEEKK